MGGAWCGEHKWEGYGCEEHKWEEYGWEEHKWEGYGCEHKWEGHDLQHYLFLHQHSLLVDLFHCKPLICRLKPYQVNRAVQEKMRSK